MNKFTRELSNKENCISLSPPPSSRNFDCKDLKFFNKMTKYDDMEIIHAELHHHHHHHHRPQQQQQQHNEHLKNSDFEMNEELITPEYDEDDDDDDTITSDGNRHHRHHHKNYFDCDEAINLKVCPITVENSQSVLPPSPMEEPELVPIDGKENAIISLGSHNSYLINPPPLISNDDSDPLNVKEDQKKPTKILLQNQNRYNDGSDLQVVQLHYSPVSLDSDEDCKEHHLHTKNFNHRMQKSPNNLSFQIPKDITITAVNIAKPIRRQPTVIGTNLTNQQLDNSVGSPTTATANKKNFLNSTSSVVATIDLIDSSDEDATTSEKSMLTIRKSKKSVTKLKRCLLTDEMYQKQFLDYLAAANNIKQARKSLEPTILILPPPTAQSEFLSAVNLQPVPIGINPYTSQTFYPKTTIGNFTQTPPPQPPPSSALPTTLPLPAHLQQQYNISWLEYFIKQFANPQLIATHACYAFLQRALKYKEFVRIKAERLELSVKFLERQKDTTVYLENSLKWSLQQMFFKNSKELTKPGKRFCELINNRSLKPITLLSNVATGSAALKTLHTNYGIFNEILRNSDKTNTLHENLYLTSFSTNTMTATTASRKRHCNDEDEYMPSKSLGGSLQKTIANGVAERKLSLRTKRTRRLDSNFSYNEEISDADADIDADMDAETSAAAAAAIAASKADIQRRVDEKRLEAQRRRQLQVKSFENEFIQVLGKNMKLESTCNLIPNSLYSKENNFTKEYPLHKKLEGELLPSTWMAHRGAVITDSRESESKDYGINSEEEVLPLNLSEKFSTKRHNSFPNLQYHTDRYQLVKPRGRRKKIYSILPNGGETVFGVGDNMRFADGGGATSINGNITKSQWPKNIDINMHINGRSKGVCVICKLNAQRMVQHYVNEHRGCEIYISRLTIEQIDALKCGQANLASISIYKNGQNQYKANCIFCDKPSRFMLPYWYQHFTMHTGEYAYRCTVCGVRKPTRSLLSQYHAQPYPCIGDITQDYVFDSKAKQIEACLCTLCNYVQLQRRNILIHLKEQHNIQEIQSQHIDTVVLLRTTVTPHTITAETVEVKEKISGSVDQNTSKPPTLLKDDGDDDDNKLENHTQNIVSNENNRYCDYISQYTSTNTAVTNNQLFDSPISKASTTSDSSDTGENCSLVICGMLDNEMKGN